MARQKKSASAESGNGGSFKELLRELWEAAVRLRGNIEPADYKRYVLPIIFLRFLSLRYEGRRAELEVHVRDAQSDYFGLVAALDDPDEYKQTGALILPDDARWENIVAIPQADD